MISGFINIFYMAQEQKESIDRTFVQFMQPDLGFRTGVPCLLKIILWPLYRGCQAIRDILVDRLIE